MRTRYLRALIAVLFVSGVAGATFFVSNRLSTSQNVAPNAPESEPQAFSSTIRNGIRLPDEDIRDIKNTTPPKSSAPIVGRSDEKDYDPAEISKPNPTTTPFRTPNQPTPKVEKTPTPSNKPAATPNPTPKPDTYGSIETSDDPNSYKSKANNPCKDGLGFVSGTGCFKNQATGEYERKTLALESTQKQAREALATAQQKISNKSDTELLQIATQNGTNNCKETDYACQRDVIKATTTKLLQENLVFATKDIDQVATVREKNQALSDVAKLTDKELLDKYKTTDRGIILTQKGVENATEVGKASTIIALYSDPTKPSSEMITLICGTNKMCISDLRSATREEILKQGVGSNISKEYIDETIKVKKDEAKAKKYIDLYINQNLSDRDKIDIYCRDNNIDQATCKKNVDIEELARYSADPEALIQLKKDYSTQRIISDPNNDLNDLAKIYCGGRKADCTTGKILGQIKNEEIKQSTNDQLLSKFYMDIQNNTSDLAEVYCGASNKKCISEFSKENLLSAIKDPNVKQFAQANRNNQLFQYIVPLKTNQSVDIDNDTKREVERLDIDFQHAYWAYWKEQTAGKTASQVNNDKLGEDFYKLFATNPSEFNKYLTQYNANPKAFTDIQTATAYKAGTDINSSIIALSNQAVKSSPIKGLFDGNKIVSWNGASEEYKQEARELACANDKSIAIYCSAIDGYASKRITEEQRKNALAQIDAAITNSNKQTAYLQEVYDNKITNNLPSSFYSNTVAIDNFTISQDLRNKAIEDAKNQMYGDITRGGKINIAQGEIIRNTTIPTNIFSPSMSPLSDVQQKIIENANQSLDYKLVTETYTRGGGMAASLAAAGLATTACAALGPGAAFCGAVGGLAGAIATYVPIWGTVTAEEMAAEQQAIKDFKPVNILENDIVNLAMSITPIGILEKNLLQKYGDQQIFNNDTTAGLVQSLYSNQGALCDTADGLSIGGSCTRKDNQYANYQSMLNTYGQIGANLNNLSDQNFVSQLAIQGTINQEFDALQKENQNQAIANIIIAPIIGAASGGIGGKLAQANAPINNANYLKALYRQQVVDWSLWAPGSALGVIQNAAQFDTTSGFIDTQSEIDLEICIREKGRDKCDDKQKTVDNETKDAMLTTLAQGFLTDTALQVGQSGFSFATQYAQIASQNPNTPPPNTDAATSNLIASSATTDTPNTPPPNTTPTSTLSTNIKNVLNEITSDTNVLRGQPETTISEVKANTVIDNVEKTILTTILEKNKSSSQEFFKNPNSDNFNKLINDINNTAEKLTPQFGGDVDAAKAGIIEILQIIETRENLSGRTPVEIENLVNATKVQAGIYKPTSASTPDYTTATPIDPITSATERLIDTRARRNEDLTLNEVRTVLEGIDEIAENGIAIVHKLQQSPDFQDAVKQVSSALAQADAAKKAISNTDIASLFEVTSERIVFDKTAELAKKISPSNTNTQTQATAQPNTPPSATPPNIVTEEISTLLSIEADNTKIIKRLGNINDNYRIVYEDIVDIANTDNTKIVRFAKEQLGIDIENKTLQQIVTEIKANPKMHIIKEMDAEGNLRYNIVGVPNVTFVADKNSPVAISAKKLSQSADIRNKSIGDLPVESTPKSPTEVLSENNNLPGNLKAEIQNEYGPNQIAKLNTKLADPNYKPSDNRLVRIIRRMELTPEDAILNRAVKLTEINEKTGQPQPYDISTKSLSQISADLRAIDNQFGNNKNLTALTREQRLKSLEFLPRRLVQKLAEVLTVSPNAKVIRVDVPANEHRYVGAKYLYENKEWKSFIDQLEAKIPSDIPQSKRKAIIAGIEDLFISRLKASFMKANPDYQVSPKGPDQDTFIDLNPSRKESIELIKSYFENEFQSEITGIRDYVNKTIKENGSIRIIENDRYTEFQIPQNWGLELNLTNLKPSEFIVVSISRDPKVNSFFNIVNNKEAYFIANGTNEEILNAVFSYHLLDKDANGNSKITINENFPVIEQVANPNDPDKHLVPGKGIRVAGSPMDPDLITSLTGDQILARQETNFQNNIVNKLNDEIINLLTNYNYDSGVSADGLVSQLDNTNRGRVEFGNTAPLEMVFENGTGLEFSNNPEGSNTYTIAKNTNQVANDIAGFSLSTKTITEAAQKLPPKEAEDLFDGMHTIFGNIQDKITIRLQKIAEFRTYEHAGDGIRGSTENTPTIDTIRELVELSGLYQIELQAAIRGDFGPNAQKTANILFGALGDSVFLKVGIGTGDTLYQYLPGNVEVKSSVNVDEYLDNVKKYVNQERDAKRTPPSEIIGVSETISKQYSDEDLAKAGLKRIVIEKFNEDKTAYFIVKDQTKSVTPASTTPTPPTPPRKNNTLKKNIIEIIETITLPPKETAKTNPAAETKKSVLIINKIKSAAANNNNTLINSALEKAFKLSEIEIEYIGRLKYYKNDQDRRSLMRRYSEKGVKINPKTNLPEQLKQPYIKVIEKIIQLSRPEPKVSTSNSLNSFPVPKQPSTTTERVVIRDNQEVQNIIIKPDFNEHVIEPRAPNHSTLPSIADIKKYLESIKDPYQRQAEAIIAEEVIKQHVSHSVFLEQLDKSVKSFNQRVANKDYITIIRKFKSNEWVFSLAANNLEKLPKNVFDQNFATYHDISEYLKSNPNVRTIAFFDDGSYTGSQLSSYISDVIRNLDDNGIKKIEIEVVVPFISNKAKQKIIDKGGNIHFNDHQIMPSISELFSDNPEKLNQLKLSTQDITFDDHYLVTFDHKIADYLSTPNLSEKSYIPIPDTPYSTGYDYTTSASKNTNSQPTITAKIKKTIEKIIIDTTRQYNESPKLFKKAYKSILWSTPAGALAAFFAGMNWGNIFSQQQTIPTPTPTAIYASPTPTNTPTPTITIQPTITITPTPTLFTPATTVPVSYSIPKVGSLSSSQMTEFSLTAKAVGQMIINCQNDGIYGDAYRQESMVECICKQTTNNCAAGSIEKTIAEDIAQLADGKEPLECIEFLLNIERTRPDPVASGCEAQNGNGLIPSMCSQKKNGDLHSYFCPKEVVEKIGFVEGDIIVTEDNREDEPGHAEVCTELTEEGCTAVGANYNKDGRVAFRPVSKDSNFAGVWRGGTNIEGCTQY